VFHYVGVCGNHIIHGQRNVQEFRIRHIGERGSLTSEFFKNFSAVKKFADSDTMEERDLIARAQKVTLGDNKEEVADYVYNRRVLSHKAAEAVYDIADEFSDIHGNPNTVWGYVAGMTRYSQQQPFADVRNDIDRSARKLLAMATN
jgi:hypothetical protein